YGTFRPDDGGVQFPAPSVVRRDLVRMAERGFNAVRTYTPPPGWLLDDAMRAGLRVMVGVPWEQHVAFLDEPGRSEAIGERVGREVAGCAGHPAVLCYAVGNEIPAAIVRWSGRSAVEGHIRRLCEAARMADPDGLVTYVNYPSTEYLDLPFLDLLAFNVYLESPPRLAAYLSRLHNRAGDRPLLLAEVGLDSRRNGLERQARLLRAQLRLARSAGCAGTFTFAWTDEWHRGGREVEDWDFGLTTRRREPKPALAAVSRAFAEPLEPPSGRWPRISVVVCVFNGAATLPDCLEGLEELDYPDYEVIVVDDGSADPSSRIARNFDVRLIRTENRGLSRARNTGIDAATGEVVAFLDADARPDPDWLTHLALGFGLSDYVGMGGPNVPPDGIDWVASCVADAPGGPVHVLRTDVEAEHVPGCNMAFRRWALKEIGGFDPRFRVAGDDVDLCWRIHERGWRIGFSPGAMVWHHPRDSVAAYWRQQVGYGRAEAQLESKWPEKYNAVGHVTWGGRVYGTASRLSLFRRQRIYGGTWGQAPFQLDETPPAAGFWEAAAMPEWYMALLVLLVLSVLGIGWGPLLVVVPFLVAGLGLTLSRALAGGLGVVVVDPRAGSWDRIRRRALTALLHLLQPLARLSGRLEAGLVPWRSRSGARSFQLPRERRLRFWRWVGESAPEVLRRIESDLVAVGSVVRRGGGYDDWDLEVEGGGLGAARLRSCVEWYGDERQLLRIAVAPRLSPVARWGVAGAGVLAFWAFVDGAVVVGLVLAVCSAVLGARALWESGTSLAVLVEGAREAADHGIELTGREEEDQGEEPAVAEPRPARAPERAWLRAAG
ncbi:MAG TPA: glycosyltransferase, partial [Longimicrobiales bacterium]|nr:glycosyltransferase [Longimicrobiales bacterium]